MQTVEASPDVTRGTFGEDDADARRTRFLRVWFYVGIPLLLAFVLAWMRIGRAAEWPVAVGLLYWFGFQVLIASLGTLFTAPVARALRPRGLPLWLTLAVGQLFASIAVIPAVQIWQCAVNDILPMGATLPTIPLSLESVAQIVPTAVCYWLLLNLLFVDLLGIPRFGYAATGAQFDDPRYDSTESLQEKESADDFAEPRADETVPALNVTPATTPAFFERVRAERRGDLLALRAEGHYLRVYTDKGSELITYRLSDALAEIPPGDGMQVHRSWWVADRSLTPQRQSDRVKLVNGLEVPVSRSYVTAARQRGWLNSR